MMLENLEERGISLKGIHEHPSTESQKKRMIEIVKMTEAECHSMNEVYSKLLNKEEKSKIEKLEMFDEFEEWELL
eukprot:CAMPEP_0170547666 /NCGR_PEP_ID=MMETSP0211-20121228/6043_1 /TAXON_ID=311385 /ORGANISM="Pseudokeronopsis sp., Strain OXSARD2" /LENGTH=74 /DNA_ID=CAMNT_0010852815 /DNA_START=653 /DNA_END=877 /DNA_ORIENTATION=-